MTDFGPPLTDIPAMLRMAADRLEQDGFTGQIILISDGIAGSFEVASFGDTDSMMAQAAIATAQAHLASLRLAQP